MFTCSYRGWGRKYEISLEAFRRLNQVLDQANGVVGISGVDKLSKIAKDTQYPHADKLAKLVRDYSIKWPIVEEAKVKFPAPITEIVPCTDGVTLLVFCKDGDRFKINPRMDVACDRSTYTYDELRKIMDERCGDRIEYSLAAVNSIIKHGIEGSDLVLQTDVTGKKVWFLGCFGLKESGPTLSEDIIPKLPASAEDKIREQFGPDVHIEPGQDEDGMVNGRFL